LPTAFCLHWELRGQGPIGFIAEPEKHDEVSSLTFLEQIIICDLDVYFASSFTALLIGASRRSKP
jgi:hypothetical protein